VDRAAPVRLFASTDLDQSLKEWYEVPVIVTPDWDCVGTCTGPVRGAGVAIECSSTDYIIDLNKLSNDSQPLFKIDFSRDTDDSGLSVLNMRLLYVTGYESSCRAKIATQSCSVRLATVIYSTIRRNTTIALDHTIASSDQTNYPQTLEIQSILANASSVDNLPADALSAIEYFGYYFLQSNATAVRPGTPGGEISWEPSGVIPRQYTNFLSNNDSCALQWDNATDDLIWALHDVMFRLAYASASGKYGKSSQYHLTQSHTLSLSLFWICGSNGHV